MAKTEAQKRASLKYDREKTKSLRLVFYPKEMDIYNHLQTKENKNGYIKSLIRMDMETGDYEDVDNRIIDVGEDLREEDEWE